MHIIDMHKSENFKECETLKEYVEEEAHDEEVGVCDIGTPIQLNMKLILCHHLINYLKFISKQSLYGYHKLSLNLGQFTHFLRFGKSYI